jgi:hypothetical protein
MDDITKIMIGNLTATLLAALNELDAPQDTKDALTENGDLEHVHWWITEGRGLPNKQGEPHPLEKL